MGNQAVKIGDVVAVTGQVKWIGEGRFEVELADRHAAQANIDAAAIAMPNFEVGDEVVIEGEGVKTYVIKCVDGEFAWLFSEIEGFDTVDLASLRRSVEHDAPANPR